MSYGRILIAAMIITSAAFGNVYYVSTTGDDSTGDGSMANPFRSVTNAYQVACLTGSNCVLQIMPGEYTEEGGLVLSNSLVSLRGSGAEQTSLNIPILVTNDTAIADLEISAGVPLTNLTCVLLHNVKLLQPPTQPGNIIGEWRDASDTIHIRNVGADLPTDSVPRFYVDNATGTINGANIKLGTVAEARIDSAIARNTEVTSATNAAMNESLGRFVKKTGDGMSGMLIVSNQIKAREKIVAFYPDENTKAYLDIDSGQVFSLVRFLVGGNAGCVGIKSGVFGSFNSGYALTSFSVGAPSSANHSTTKSYVDNTTNSLQKNITAVSNIAVARATVTYVDGATNAVGNTWDSRWVNVSGDTINGSLTVTGSITSVGDWHVGSASNGNYLIMENDSSFIMSKVGSGNNLRLMADHANGGQIVIHSPVSMPGMAGRVTSVDTTSGYQVSNNYCRETSVVMITPVYGGTIPTYSVAVSNNSFTVHGNTGNNTWSFNYLIMNP